MTEYRIETAPLLSDVCPRPRCGMRMRMTLCEHVIIRTCPCGYESKEVSGETKFAYHEARNLIR